MGRKTKKQKKELSQAEIWDDSALVQSWDDALAEYKVLLWAIICVNFRLTCSQRYHSIHARGQRVEDVIKDLETNGEGPELTADAVVGSTEDAPGGVANGVVPGEREDGEWEEGEAEEVEGPPTNGGHQHSSSEQASFQTARNQHSSVPAVPAAMTDTVKDDGLKNLMMSWYYAGYYTGLYEGQRPAMEAPAK